MSLREIYRGENHIDFPKWWKRGLVFSAALILASVVSLVTQGLNLGIDFEGGTSFEVIAPGVSVSEARSALEGIGEGSAKIQIVGEDTVRVQGPTESIEKTAEIRQTLADLAGVDPSEVGVSEVGPSWGDEITDAAVRALVIFLAVITLYLTIRLEWAMAVAAITAMLHDIIITVGVYSIFQFEVTPGTVVAFLTILGYSIYDTIVVFDKVKENEGRVGTTGRLTYTDMVSLSTNQVLLRSLNTTITSLIPVLSILIVGAQILGAITLQEFGLALFIGLLSGAYSSIFIAMPTLVAIKERQKRYRVIRERVEASRGSSASPIVSGAVDEPASAVATARRPTATPSAGASPQGAIPPRPRKQGKRR